MLPGTDVLICCNKVRRTTGNWLVPKYFACFYNPGDPKSFAASERERRMRIVAQQLVDLHHRSDAPDVCSDVAATMPYSTPLIKPGKSETSYRRKYKYVRFLDLSHLQHAPLDVISQIDSSCGPFNLPVFLFTWTELVDISEILITILRYLFNLFALFFDMLVSEDCFATLDRSYRPDCTLMFVPERRMKEAARVLMDAQEWYSRKGQLTGAVSYHALLDSVDR